MTQEEIIKSQTKLLLKINEKLKKQEEKIDYLTEAVDQLVCIALDNSRSTTHGRIRRTI